MRASAVATLNKPIRCLVVQFSEMDDTLQSLMALRAAKQLYPNLEIHFVASEKCADAAKRVPWIETVTILPAGTMLDPVVKGEKTEMQGLRDLAKWIAPLIKAPWDLLVNWSYTDASSYLTGLLPARVKLGYTRRKDSSFAAADGWSHYIQGIVLGGVRQNVHLTDILTTQLLTALQIHFGEPANDGNAPVTSKSFFSLELNEKELGWCWRDYSRKWVAVQLEPRRARGVDQARSWDSANWATLVQMILKRNPDHSVVLLGNPENEALARDVISTVATSDQTRLLSMVGKTDFDLWASVVSGCQWLFAEDTAAIHLASVLGTRVMSIGGGAETFAQCGPYGNGHYVITRAKSDAEIIAPQAVYAAWTYAVHEWAHRRQYTLEAHFEKLGWKTEGNTVQVYRSKIRGTHDGGGVVYEPQITRTATLEEWLSMVMGHMARAWYCGWVPPIGQELIRERISPALVKTLRELDETTKVMTQIYGESILTALAINKKSGKLKSKKLMQISDRDEITDLGRKLQELDQLVERLVTAQPALKAFTQMGKVLLHNLKSDQLPALGRESAVSYRQLNDGVAILRDWLSHTLQLAKPVSVGGRAEKTKALGSEAEV